MFSITTAALAFIPFVSTFQVGSEEAKLVAGDAAPGDQAGWSVSIHGDTAVVGAPEDDHAAGTKAGSAYVHVRAGTQWSEQAQLVSNDAAAGDHFGISVDVHHETIVVGSPRSNLGASANDGAAYVFVRSGTSWSQQARLRPSVFVPGSNFGQSVSIHGDTVVVGAPLADPGGKLDAGAAYVFLRQGTIWSQEAELLHPDPSTGDRFGAAVAVEGQTALIGARKDDTVGGFDAGSAHVYLRTGNIWSAQGALLASDGNAGDAFGEDVVLSGDTVVVGALLHDLGGGLADAGAAYVYGRSGSVWSEEAKLVASDPGVADYFGHSVAVLGNTLVVGAPGDNLGAGFSQGSAYVFEHTGTDWAERAKLTASDGEEFDFYGFSVALHGDSCAIGSCFDDSSAGSAYVVRLSTLAPVTYCTAGISASGCQATMSASGVASATAASGFELSASNVEGAKEGLFFYGTEGRQANPWGNGTSYRCVAPPVKRGGLLLGTGTSGACDGHFTQDLNAKWQAQPAHSPGAGAVVQAQLWYRDPFGTSNQTTSFSDAIEFTVSP